MKTNTHSLGFVIGQVYTLSQDDWDGFKATRIKSKAALIGLAIDVFAKRHALAEGAIISTTYAEWDAERDGIHYDFKSFSKNSISVSEAEMFFSEKLIANGGRMIHVLFEQLGDDNFKFRGYIDFADLHAAGKLCESQYQGFYYSLNVIDRFVFA